MVSSNVSKGFQRYLVLDILTNPKNVTLTEEVTFWGKIHYQCRCLPATLLKIKFVPFLKSWHATIPWKKDDKVGKKLLIKKKGKEKKRERAIEKDRVEKKKLNFGLCASVKTKKLFNYVRLVGKYAFFDAKFILSHSFSHAN